jgi:S1-C subfamily serine protease
VRVFGTACGLGIAGSGWVAGDGLVVTAAHVVAGEVDTTVAPPGGSTLSATTVSFDATNDVAVLRVDGLNRPALALAEARRGDAVAILGYPGDGPFRAVPGRIGSTLAVLGGDAYGKRVLRTVTGFRGIVRHGDSGGPVVNAAGDVEATVFAAREGSNAGYGVPTSIVRKALDRARGPVSTGDCAP